MTKLERLLNIKILNRLAEDIDQAELHIDKVRSIGLHMNNYRMDQTMADGLPASLSLYHSYLRVLPGWKAEFDWRERWEHGKLEPQKCDHRIDIPMEPYKGTMLRVEAPAPQARCIQKKPDHWPESATALRWIGSGGDPMVFGYCETRNCPKNKSSYWSK